MKFVLMFINSPTSIPKKAYASPVALLMKPIDMFKVFCQFVVTTTVKVPAEHEP